jgi:uncharacterized RDD family membrane protein YckC
MSSQTPEPSASPSQPAAPEPDAETARVPLQPAPPTEEPEPEPEAPPPPTGIISAAPVGLPGAAQPTSTPDAPPAAWAAPLARPAAPLTEGLVIAGVFSRVVAYAIDAFFLGTFNLAIFGLLGLYSNDANDTVALIVSVGLIAIDFVYFVGLWTSGWQGTMGMRLLRLRVLGATSAQTIPLNDALLRWLALSGTLSILALVPGLGRYIGLIELAWFVALLFSAAMHPLRQGFHDRWARSVVAQPAPGGSGAALVGCIVLGVVIFVVLPILVLTLAGPEIQDILTRIGESV